MHSSILKIAAVIALVLPLQAWAGSMPDATQEVHYNPLLIALISLAVVFVFAIGMLAVALKQLAQATWDKQRKERNSGNLIKPMLLLCALCIPAVHAWAQEPAAAATEAVAEVSSSFISGIPKTDFYFITGVLAFELLIMLVLLHHILGFISVLRGIPEKAHVPAQVFGQRIWKMLNKSVAIEEEATIMMDHDYDGIHELDNDLPPWWKYGFVLTIIVAFLYLGYYHAAGGPSQVDEYNEAVAKGEEEKAAYLAKTANNVDENTVTMVLDASQLAAAEGIFQTTCAACHAKDGGGNVGPNLTDNYWLHGGGIKDVFKSIKYGWPEKGMKSWKDDYSPKQIAALASYVKTLKGTKPLVAKAPQGDLFVEGGDKAIHSVSSKTDPSLEASGKKENKDNPIGPYPAKKN